MKITEYIDHTLLKPDATEKQIKQLCNEAKKYGFASVCVNPYYAKLVSEELKGSNVKTCVVVGFPLGASTKEIKAFEAQNAVQNGAQEVDMVMNIGALKDKKYDVIQEDIQAVVHAVKGKAIVKVIVECCLLTRNEKIKACELAIQAGAAFVKTSTGFSKGGATIEDVELMKSVVGSEGRVKASGGIRDAKTAAAMLRAGASRIGTSAGVNIAEEIHQDSISSFS